jgi:hypothetical protein
MEVKPLFEVPIAVAELDVVDEVPEETEDCPTKNVDDVPVEIEIFDVEAAVDEEAVVKMTVPFLMYTESLFPAPISQIREHP